MNAFRLNPNPIDFVIAILMRSLTGGNVFRLVILGGGNFEDV